MGIFSIRIRYITLLVLLVVFTAILQISVLRIFPILPIGIFGLIIAVGYKFTHANLKIYKSQLYIAAPLFLAAIFSIPPIIINGIIDGFINYAGLFIAAFCIIILLSNSRKNIFIESLNRWMIIITLIIVVASIAVNGIYFNRYLGIFNNPNNTGAFASAMLTFFVSLFIIRRIYNIKTSYINNVFIIACSIILLGMLIASTSRGSLLSFFAGIFVSYLACLVRKKSQNNLKHSDLRSAMLVALVLAGVVFALYWSGVFNEFILKLSARESQYGRIDPRLHIWTRIIDNIEFWGIGADYSNMLKLSYGAHNTFLSQAVLYGIPSASFYLIFILNMLRIGFKNMKGQGGKIAILGLGMGTSYFVRGLFETVAASPDFWVFLILISLSLAKDKKSVNFYASKDLIRS